MSQIANLKDPTTRMLEWGGSVPSNSPAAWGARAIYALVSRTSKLSSAGKRLKTPQYTTEAMIDLLWDRQDAYGEPDDRAALRAWINGKALPALKKLCIKEGLTDDDERMLAIESDGYRLEASPRESCGYLYLIAWKL